MKVSVFKKISIIFIIILLILVGFKTLRIHTSVFNNYFNRHIFIFKDSILDNINWPSYSWVSEQDTLTHFVVSENVKNKKKYYELNDTCTNYYVSVWRFNTLRNCDLNQVYINKYYRIVENSNFIFEQVLDSDGDYPISVRYLYNIDVWYFCGRRHWSCK